MSTHYRTCPLCEAMCGLEIRVTDGTVDRIRGDRDDVWSKGYLCPKGTALGHLHHDPDRIREPMVRTGDRWEEVSWEAAFARCDELLAGVLAEHGKDAVSCYIGNPTAHNFSLGRYVGLFIGLAALPVVYSAGTVDQWPKNLTAALMYGGMWDIPTPDVPRTDYWMILGGNPQASQGSLLACADILGELEGIRERGGKVVVVDPRRTETATRADEWVPILPGTDAAFLLAMVHILFADDLVDLGDVADLIHGLDAVARRGGRVHARTGRGDLSNPGRDHPAAGPRVRDGSECCGLRPHRHVQPGVRHARFVARGRGQHPHRELRPARRDHVRQAHRVGRQLAAEPGTRARRATGQVAVPRYAASPKYSARSPSRVCPRRSTPPARARSAPSSRSPGTPLSAPRARDGSTTPSPPSTA